MITFSNPRLSASFDDWPYGGSKRGACYFNVRTEKKGQRVERVTTGKPKCTTYGNRMCIVDGSNGRTYLLQEITSYGRHTIHIIMSDCQHDAAHDLGLPSSYFCKTPVSSDSEKAQAESAMFNTLLEMLNRAK